MDAEHFRKSIAAFQNRKPFEPYVIEFSSGDRLQIEHPESLIHREGVAVHFSPNKDITLLDHDGVTRITEERQRASA